MGKYFRITYDGIGIYEALKKQIWFVSTEPVKVWNSLKESDAFNWLSVPNVYEQEDKKYYSYFTETGYEMFKKLTLPVIKEWLEESKMNTEELSCMTSRIVYQDEYQIVIEQ